MHAVTGDGQYVGAMYFGEHPTCPGAMEGVPEVHPDHRRRGIATAMYDYATELDGRPMVPSDSPSDDAAAFWRARRAAVDAQYEVEAEATASSLAAATQQARHAREAAARLAPADFTAQADGEAGDAERALAGWAALRDQRDPLVQAALAAGVSKTRIQEITRVSRSTIDRQFGPLPHRVTMKRPAEDFELHTEVTADAAVYCLIDRRTGKEVWDHRFALDDQKGVIYHYGNAVAASHGEEELWGTERIQSLRSGQCYLCAKDLQHHGPVILRAAYEELRPDEFRVREVLIVACFEDSAAQAQVPQDASTVR